jgi:hypothetical protein
MDTPRIRVKISSGTVMDLPLGAFFMVHGMKTGEMLDTRNGITFEFLEGDKVLIERQYTDTQLNPFRDADD